MIGAVYCTAAKFIKQSDTRNDTTSYTLQAGWSVQSTSPDVLSYDHGEAQVAISSPCHIKSSYAEHIRHHKEALLRASIEGLTEENTNLFSLIDEMPMHTDQGLEAYRFKILHNVTRGDAEQVSTYYKIFKGPKCLTVRCIGPKNQDTENTVAYEKIIHSIAFN